MYSFAIAACLCAFVVPSLTVEDNASIVAQLDGEPVFVTEVDRELRAALPDDAALAQVAAPLRRRAAEQVVERRLVLKYLIATKQAASGQDVDFALEQLKKELKAQELTLDEYYRRGGWTEAAFRRHLTWTISWQRYLEANLNDENLKKYFGHHRADFDGTQVRVAHLLLKTPASADDSGSADQALAQANSIRANIVAGKLTFAEAAKQFSQAPTADRGGEIGFIGRREPMPESFSAAAFKLKPGEISQPVISSFGVHLIECREVKPGTRTWQEAAGDLRPAVTLYLFRWMADKQRSKTKVEWMTPLEPAKSTAPPAATTSTDQ